jgi:hypothetical protein
MSVNIAPFRGVTGLGFVRWHSQGLSKVAAVGGGGGPKCGGFRTRVGWAWGDAGLLYFGIAADDLKAGRFDRTVFGMQCC